MKKSEELQLHINDLKLQLQQAKLDEAKVLFWKDSNNILSSPEQISFYNITKLKAILNELHKGSTLLVEHEYIGEYKVWMNPQRNRTLVEKVKGFETGVTEDNVLNYMTRVPSTWYILNDE